MSGFQLVKALLARRPGLTEGATIPRLVTARSGVVPVAERLTTYRALCSLGDDGELPLPFLQMLSGDLHIALLGRSEFPLPVAGLIHVTNRIVQRGALPADGAYDLEASVEGHRDDPRGTLFDLHTRASLGSDCVWESTASILSRPKAAPKPGATTREKRSDEAPAGLDVRPARSTIWTLRADLGRRYAAISGDYNPIHLSALTARSFGFKRAIVHGMWSLARCLGELQDALPNGPKQCTVRFERPVFLPGRVHFYAQGAENGHEFTLTSPDLRTRHLRGTVSAL